MKTMPLEAEIIVHYVNFLANNTNRMVLRTRGGHVGDTWGTRAISAGKLWIYYNKYKQQADF
jgi:hypothetical protein